MAKKLYIGASSVAHKAKQIYLGSGNVARRIKSAYIGVDGSARKFWPIQYKWARYTTVITNTYAYNQARLASDLVNKVTRGSMCTSISIEQSSGDFIFNNYIAVDSSTRGDYYCMEVSYNSLYLTKVNSYYDFHTPIIYMVHLGQYSTSTYPRETYIDKLTTYVVSSQTSIGSYIDQVTSENRNAHPDNAASGSYWYVYQGEV